MNPQIIAWVFTRQMWVRSFPNVNYVLYFQKATLASSPVPWGLGTRLVAAHDQEATVQQTFCFGSHLTKIGLACVVTSKTQLPSGRLCFQKKSLSDAEWSIQESHTPFTMHLPIHPANQNQCTTHLHATYYSTTNALSICIYMYTPCTHYGVTWEC